MSLSAAGEPRPRMRIAGWVLLAGALTAYLGLPHHLREFELMTFYPRFAVLVLAMAPAGHPRQPAAPGRRGPGDRRWCRRSRWGRCTPIELIRHYRYYDQEVADFGAVVQKVPPGGRTAGAGVRPHVAGDAHRIGAGGAAPPVPGAAPGAGAA